MKGNFIGDEGLSLVASALENNKIMQEIDVSFNEIGPIGFSSLIKVLSSTNITSLICNRNPLGDECLSTLSAYINTPISKLKKIELCTCKLSDKEFVEFLLIIQKNKVIS
eukprot:TRINITY_DN3991_c0_g10_i1.p2 TRINITY_DN3991_c0_g10~~TRINITY_DN3991_c0_g10_i1.p2  ORF type:complete len:110 (+),score=34.98 TRINITY_DN3991_c0_g10_i1:306-635(+)